MPIPLAGKRHLVSAHAQDACLLDIYDIFETHWFVDEAGGEHAVPPPAQPDPAPPLAILDGSVHVIDDDDDEGNGATNDAYGTPPSSAAPPSPLGSRAASHVDHNQDERQERLNKINAIRHMAL